MNTPGGTSFLASLPRLLHEICNPVQLILRNPDALRTEQCRNNLVCRSFKKRIDKMAQRRLPDLMPGHSRRVKISKPDLLMPDVSLFFQDAQLRPHGGVAGITRQIGHHFARGRVASPVEDVHDLSLSPCQIQMWSLSHMRFF